MKKFFTVLAIIVSVSFFLSSCTEEEVKPSSGTDGGGYSVKEF
jgi:hypothetical protein